MYKLLIADDEQDIREGLQRFFPWQSIGFEVVGLVCNGQEAHEFIRENAVDVVLCDIVMPLMNGLELAKKLYEEQNRVHVVFLSAHTDFQYAKQALEYGVKSYVLKVMNSNELIDTFMRVRAELDRTHCNRLGVSDELSYNDRIVAQIKQYLSERYQRASLVELSGILHMNADYLSKFFKKYAGLNFSEYLTQVRMQKAAELLRDPMNKAGEISELVSYSNQCNFTRAFKTYYGKSPREYRLFNRSV